MSTPTKAMQEAAAVAQRLDAVLRELSAAHDELLELSRAHRRAISSADAPGLKRCTTRERDVATRVRDLEREGREIMQMIGSGTDNAPGTIREAARAIPGPAGQRLAEAADRLREKVLELQRENQAVVMATRSMLAHMEGLIRQVGQRLSSDGTYRRHPKSGEGEQMVSALDVRS